MQIAGPWKSPRREEDASRRTLVGGPVLMQRWMALIDEEALVTTKEHAGKSNRMGVKIAGETSALTLFLVNVRGEKRRKTPKLFLVE